MRSISAAIIVFLALEASAFTERRATLPQAGGGSLGSTEVLTLGNSGAYVTAFPIKGSPGRGGFEPKVSFSYSSSAGNGPLGVGWSLPLPAIVRSPNQVPKFDATDVFYSTVFGELVAIGGGYYRPLASTSYELFRFDGSVWIHWNSSGERRVFGGKIESGGLTARWLVTAELGSDCVSHDDANCRRIRYAYSDESGQDSPSAPSLAISRIDYNYVDGRPLSSIRFNYSSNRPDAQRSFRLGFPSVGTRLLSQVLVDNEGRKIRDYRLRYETSGIGRLSTLVKIAEHGKNDALIEARAFNYERLNQFSFIRRNLLAVDENRIAPIGGLPVLFADMNGDGVPDVYSHVGGLAFVRIGRLTNQGGVVYGPSQSYSDDSHVDLAARTVAFADVNGDGILDLLNTEGQLSVRLNLRSSWSPSVRLTQSLHIEPNGNNFDLVDVNGDGLTDAIESLRDGGRCYVADRSAGWTRSRPMFGHAPAGGISATAGGSYIGDFNGDGLADHARFSESERALAVWFNRGDCSWSPPTLFWPDRPFAHARTGGERTLISDLNGDGFADTVIVGTGGAYVWFNSADGALRFHGSFPVPEVLASVTAKDLNADGFEEIVLCQTTGECTALSVGNFPRENLLISSTSSTGETTVVEYQTSAKSYASDWTQFVPFLATIIKSVDESDGLFVSKRTAFRYRDMSFDSASRAFGGFASVLSEESPGRIGDRTTGPARSVQKIFDNGVADSTLQPLSRALAGRLITERQSGGVTRRFNVVFVPVGGGAYGLQSVAVETENRLAFDQPAMTTVTTDSFGPRQELVSSIKTETLRSGLPSQRVERLTTYESTQADPATADQAVAIRPTVVRIIDKEGRLLRQETMRYADLSIGTLAELTVSGQYGTPVVQRFEYDNKFKLNVTAVKDGSDALWSSTAYQSDGIYASIMTNGAGESTHLHTDPGSGLRTSETDPNGVLRTFAYDDKWNLIEERFEKGGRLLSRSTHAREEPARGRAGRVLTRRYLNENGDSQASLRFFTADGRTVETRIMGPSGSWISQPGAVRLDTLGRTAAESILPSRRDAQEFLPAPFVEAHKAMTFDEGGRQKQVDFPAERLTEFFRYRIESCGQERTCLVTQLHDRTSRKNKTETVADAFGRTVQVRHLRPTRVSSVYTYGWNGLDHLMSVEIPNREVRTFTRDFDGKALNLIDPKAGSIAFEYDHRGRLNRQIWNGSRERTSEYDLADRLVHERLTDRSSGTVEHITHRFGRSAELNEVGRVKQSDYGSASDVYRYNELGRVIKKERTFNLPEERQTASAEFQYDWMGQTLSVKSMGLHWDYRYDRSGFLTEIPGVVSSVAYDTNGSMVGLRYLNGTTSEQALDPATGLATSVRVLGAGATLSEQYRYDDSHGLIERLSHEPPIARTDPLAPERTAFAYYPDEPTYQIQSFERDGQTAGQYAWNEAGERTDDAFRRMTQRSNSFGEKVTLPNETTAVYRVDGRLARVNRGTSTVEYRYDPSRLPVVRFNGNRVERTFLTEDIQHVTGEGVVGVVRVGAIPVARLSGRRKLALHRDPLGSVIAITDESGAFIQRTKYGPWGHHLARSGRALSSYEPGFALGWDDQDAGLIRLGQRDLHPALGQFTSQDPLILSGGAPFLNDPLSLNADLYARNRPLSYLDPSGLEPVTVSLLVYGAVVGGVSAAASTYLTNPNADLKTYAISVGIGATAGALSLGATAEISSLGGIALANGGFNVLANLATQRATAPDQLNPNMVVASGFAGALGGALGFWAKNVAFFKTPVIGNTIGVSTAILNGERASIQAGAVSTSAIEIGAHFGIFKPREAKP